MVAVVFVLWALGLCVAAAFLPLPPELRKTGDEASSVRILDRSGKLIREVRSEDGARARWVSLDDMGEYAEKAMLAAEDRRFYVHPGVDPLAVVRAIGQALVHRRIVSGASTLTQQLARIVVPHRKNLGGKLYEMALAVRIEWSLSKREILEQYLNRAPFGPGLRGIEAASRFYFNRRARDLSLAEVALLSGMPRGPSLYDPAKGTTRIERRRNRVLGRMLARGQVREEEAKRATAEPIVLRPEGFGVSAPHFTRALLAGVFEADKSAVVTGGEVTTTLEASLQREAEALVAHTVSVLRAKHVSAAAAIVLDNRTGDVLAYVGSPNFSDRDNLGENDGVRALRQPGSTLKPFVYELALEKLGFTAATVLPDVDQHWQQDGIDYHPQNYDGRYHGPVLVREALANSYNVPAVYTASLLGPRLLTRLRELDFASLDQEASYYGSGLALGDGEVRLLDLAQAYATLARGGVKIPVRARKAQQNASLASLATAVLAKPETQVITDILSDTRARAASFGLGSALELPFPVAVKTGTSKGFRDNWTVGYTSEVTVGVWVGNFDGSPMLGVSGVTGAGPLFRGLMMAAARKHPEPSVPSDAHGTGDSRAIGHAHPDTHGEGEADRLVEVEVCALSGARPTKACPHVRREIFVVGTVPEGVCSMHETARIDRRNGFLAGPSCSANLVEERSYEAMGGPFASWAKLTSRPLAPQRFSPLCPDASRLGGPAAAPSSFSSANSGASTEPFGIARLDPPLGAATRVLFPTDGATFVYDEQASAHQAVLLRAEAPARAKHVRFFVDGKLVAVKEPPFATEWSLARGSHHVRTEADGAAASEAVTFTVQ